MGATIFVSVRDSDRPSDDHSLMLALERYLDGLCEKLKVVKLSDFHDYSAMAAEYLDEFEGGGSEGNDAIRQEALAERWFDPRPALESVRAIVARLEHTFDELGFRPDASRAHWPDDLMDELRDALEALEDAVARGRQFRFLVVP